MPFFSNGKNPFRADCHFVSTALVPVGRFATFSQILSLTFQAVRPLCFNAFQAFSPLFSDVLVLFERFVSFFKISRPFRAFQCWGHAPHAQGVTEEEAVEFASFGSGLAASEDGGCFAAALCAETWAALLLNASVVILLAGCDRARDEAGSCCLHCPNLKSLTIHRKMNLSQMAALHTAAKAHGPLRDFLTCPRTIPLPGCR